MRYRITRPKNKLFRIMSNSQHVTFLLVYKYTMPGKKSTRLVSKKKKRKKKMYLMTSKKCWLVEDCLVPLYQHLLDVYSEKLNGESNVTLGECDMGEMLEVKHEPQDDDFMESPYVQQSKPTDVQVLTYFLNLCLGLVLLFLFILFFFSFLSASDWSRIFMRLTAKFIVFQHVYVHQLFSFKRDTFVDILYPQSFLFGYLEILIRSLVHLLF